jgi:putative heme-binding domain-containing protein
MRSLLLAVLLCPFVALAENSPLGATLPAAITVAPGFKVELLRSAGKNEGSWVSMAIDPQGRLYISCQGKPPGAGMKADDQWGGLYRVTLDARGQVAHWEQVPVPVGDSMGMLWAFDSLYVSGEGPEGRGIYRLKSAPEKDVLTTWQMWKKVPGGNGEHGAHALVLGPDGKSIYIVHGNSTPLIKGVDAMSPYRNYAEDDLLPRVMDPVATFFDKIKSPYGYVLKTDEGGTKWELIAGGFRNPYDIDFNADGELFTYDSDMEWDVGSPWYRPTRVLHVVPGGEYGFREGTSKWPAWYPDSLPAAVDIGLGCPTGVKFGTRSNFPAKYKGAFFIMDWTFGRIIAVHLKPKGSSYTASNPMPSPYTLTGPSTSTEVEDFVKGKGLPVTDLEFGADGAMYFTIGGRGTQAGLYRVSWAGEAVEKLASAVPAPRSSSEAAGAAKVPSRVKAVVHPEPILSQLFPELGSVDRFSRYRGRIALEAWADRSWAPLAISEKDPHTALTALLALARVGAKDDQEVILKALAKFPLDSLPDDLKLDKLRVIEVALARHGRPSTDLVNMAIEKLSAQYPAKTFALNRELVQLLVYLGAPDVVEKTLALMDSTEEPAEQVWLALCLREATAWTPAQRERYFAWFARAKTYRGGNSFGKFILRIRDQALAKLPDAERPALLALAEKTLEPAKPAVATVARPFVKMWTLADLEPALGGVAKGRDFARGKRLYTETTCAQCHLFAGAGGTAQVGAIGPDLTAVGSRFSARDILEAITDPSKIISEQYQSFLLTMKDGSMAGGQIAEENHYLVTLVVDPLTGAKQNFPANKIAKREASPASLMPPGLLATLSQEEVLDLLAYLQSGGNEKAPAFTK